MLAAASYLEALGKEIGVKLELTPLGSVGLALEGRNLLLQWQEGTHSFLVYVEVGQLGGWRNNEVCRLLLEANFLLVTTQGGAFSLDAGTNTAGLNFLIPAYGLEPAAFVVCLNNIILVAEEWTKLLTAMNAAQEQAVDKAQQAIFEAVEHGGVQPRAVTPPPMATFMRG